MTLTELKYVIAVARERHFGRAAESCFVSQPSLSVAIKKLEEELGVSIFERRTPDISITPVGAAIIEQAQKVADEQQAADAERCPKEQECEQHYACAHTIDAADAECVDEKAARQVG